jgi:hypothetical protein
MKEKKDILDIDEMRDLYFRGGVEVDQHWKESLRWHLQHGDQFETVDLIGDIALCSDSSVNELASDVLKLLKQNDYFIGMEVISCILAYMKLPEYVEYFLNFYESDRGYEYDDSIKDRIIFDIGNVINKITAPNLKRKAAEFVLSKFSEEQPVDNKTAAYSSIMTAMGVPSREQPFLETEEELKSNIDWKLVQAFKEKYID